jgi:hypothetical protein
VRNCPQALSLKHQGQIEKNLRLLWKFIETHDEAPSFMSFKRCTVSSHETQGPEEFRDSKAQTCEGIAICGARLAAICGAQKMSEGRFLQTALTAIRPSHGSA